VLRQRFFSSSYKLRIIESVIGTFVTLFTGHDWKLKAAVHSGIIGRCQNAVTTKKCTKIHDRTVLFQHNDNNETPNPSLSTSVPPHNCSRGWWVKVGRWNPVKFNSKRHSKTIFYWEHNVGLTPHARIDGYNRLE